MAEIVKFEGEMFWDADDPEWSREDPDEFFNEGHMDESCVAHFQQASRLEDFYGFSLRNNDGDHETHYFPTKEEAEAALKGYRDRAPIAKGEDE